MEDKSLQNNDITLPGGLGTVIVGNKESDITQIFKGKDGAVTLTIQPKKPEIEIIDNSNCVFDVKRIEARLKELGALEDIECEIIKD